MPSAGTSPTGPDATEHEHNESGLLFHRNQGKKAHFFLPCILHLLKSLSRSSTEM